MTAPSEFRLVVGFGSDMGNAEDAAITFTESLASSTGIQSTAVELNQIDLAELASATHFVAVTSTFGDGEFPDNAAVFWKTLASESVGGLEHLRFAVLALGDSGYDLFCNAGRLLDERLEELGATRLTARVDVDGFYEEPAAAWASTVIDLLSATPSAAGTGQSPARSTTDTGHAESSERHHHAVDIRIVVNRPLSSPDSDKEVRHLEFDLAGSGLTYQAGDSIAVHARNNPALVASILDHFGVDSDHPVAGQVEPVGVLLADRLDIRSHTRALRTLVATRTRDTDAVAALAEPIPATPGSVLYGTDVLDMVRLGDFTRDELASVVETLRPLQHRDYSIASSPLAHPDRIHLTVAIVRYRNGDRDHGGVASTALADRGPAVRAHLRPNHSFRLPRPDVPIIMIGPGTGIAPFRAFLQERRALKATGRSWLFFGCRRSTSDYLYRDELAGFLGDGTLTRLDVAFSREPGSDTSAGASRPRTYVQHHLREQGAEIVAWLQDGAHLYVCGDADRMAKDVDATLRSVVAEHAAMDTESADAYVDDLILTHRYLRDVY